MIQSDKFATRLAKVNEARNGRVLPAIKLAKSIVDCFITRPSRKISGIPYGSPSDRGPTVVSCKSG